jgi:hypothetical protein
MLRVLSVLSVLLLCFSCGEKILTGDVDCAECYREKPDSADLEISLTFNDEFTEVPLVVYKGDVEDNNIEYIDTAYESPYFLYVPVDKKYSVKANIINPMLHCMLLMAQTESAARHRCL